MTLSKKLRWLMPIIILFSLAACESNGQNDLPTRVVLDDRPLGVTAITATPEQSSTPGAETAVSRTPIPTFTSTPGAALDLFPVDTATNTPLPTQTRITLTPSPGAANPLTLIPSITPTQPTSAAVAVTVATSAATSSAVPNEAIPTGITPQTVLSPIPEVLVLPTLDVQVNTAQPVAPGVPPTPASAAPQPITLPDSFAFGQSVEGRPLNARRFGTGTTLIMLVGGIHGGFESNTVELMNQLITHLSYNPGDVLPGISVVIVPVLNPDGLARGDTFSGRFNANSVDLNRNWGCGWQAEAFFQDRQVNAGTQAFSEPETGALAALIYDIRPAIVLFYHSAANGVYAGDCGGELSGMMSQVLGSASGYPYGVPFSDYVVTGTAPSWVDSLGLASADVELSSATSAEFQRNLAGLFALQCWIVGDDGTTYPQCRR